NHDDVWLDDHLEQAVARLEQEPADFFMGAAMVAQRSASDRRGGRVPIFLGRTARRRRMSQSFDRGFRWCEPASAWVLRREAAQRVGGWRPARHLWRTPIEDWVMRAWREGLRLVAGSEPTVIKMDTQYVRGGGSGFYHRESAEHRFVADYLLPLPAADFRDYLAEEFTIHRTRWHRVVLGLVRAETRLERVLRPAFFNPATRELYRRTGLDAASAWARLRRQHRGEFLRNALRNRTHEQALPGPPSAVELVDSLDAVLGDLPGNLRERVRALSR
ncbi:MAG: hypothetical protein MJE66_02125, partial [Proteobacteria bacterium]|nr:hypothetical protein [Pseudomonadota bacterium]